MNDQWSASRLLLKRLCWLVRWTRHQNLIDDVHHAVDVHHVGDGDRCPVYLG